MQPETDRRSLLGFAIFGLGSIFSAVIGVPLVCYAIDPRHRKGPKGTFRLVEGIKLDELTMNDPRQGVLRDKRDDAWTHYPSDVIGRIWVVQVGVRPDLATPERVAAFNSLPIANPQNLPTAFREQYLKVFTTICPHMGCSVNRDSAGTGFACPCHAATFRLGGDRVAEDNPAKRGMDSLEWKIDEADPEANRIVVAYKNFEASKAEKIVIGEEAPA